MNSKRTAQYARLGLALALVLAIGALAGCGSSGQSSSTAGGSGASPADTVTAKKAFAVAVSTLSTAAPDGKLLVAQVGGAVTPTSTPTWEFLIGSPKTDIIYAVSVSAGKGQFQEYGKAGLSAAEWAAVPAPDAWKVDSNVAHEKAVGVHPVGKTAAYVMGFVTYVPKSAKGSNAKAMTWDVTFDPAVQGSSPTSTVEVDMTTGTAVYAK